MGTNYYHRTGICACCGRYDETHICKSRSMFAAVTRWLDEPPYGFVVDVASWRQWKARLLEGGEVWDEYGKHIPTDEFIASVEAVAPADRERQYRWVERHRPEYLTDEPAEGKDWLDADGFSFYGGGFS